MRVWTGRESGESGDSWVNSGPTTRAGRPEFQKVAKVTELVTKVKNYAKVTALRKKTTLYRVCTGVTNSGIPGFLVIPGYSCSSDLPIPRLLAP